MNTTNPVPPPLKVYSPGLSDAAYEALLTFLEPGIEIECRKEIPPAPDYQVMVCGSPTEEQLSASPALHTLIIPWAGLPQSANSMLKAFPRLSVHNLHHNAALTAEMALALMLAAARALVVLDREFRQNNWLPRYETPQVVSLSGKTVLILGFGQIGRRIGRACLGLDMRVLAVRRSPQPENPQEHVQVFGPESLPDLLPQADVLVLALPHTPETDAIIGQKELAAMPRGGILVNVGRGALVDQAALFNALKSGQLQAAGLDVWYNYPVTAQERQCTAPADYPFHELDNVVMTPHVGGLDRENERGRMQHLAVLLNAAHQGTPIPNRVDLARGY